MDDGERTRIVLAYAAEPDLGDEIRGTGGLRKARFARPGTGKRGGYRVLSAYIGPNSPVYLMAVLKKTERANFTAAETASLSRLVAALKAEARTR
ncbi:type II toxin-antitoxin system RelE/ParE family toxin [Chthonobacter albigriseus]|uniref:type II toxin-antitoxin system RelE/ParE family toxin n=1 Tax=Chthonobacter albigriseus TaxID=1683161 RepID=UPI0015EFADA7|nr:type II toxin-antitoxin system RelE/ParE family toxin [Chthonobacter albigriseus]